MKIYKLSRAKAYHGSGIKIDAFKLDYVGQGNDADGPGIYFSSNYEDAVLYGDEMHEVELNFNKWIEPKGDIPWGEVKQIALWGCGVNNESELDNLSEEEFYETNLSDWAEDPYMAFMMIWDSIKSVSKDPFDAFQNVWINLYRYREREFLENMVKLGYDGAIMFNKNNSGINHYVVYNPSIIQMKSDSNENV